MKSAAAVLLLLAIAQSAAATDFGRLVLKAQEGKTECDDEFCLGQFSCGEVSELSSRLQEFGRASATAAGASAVTEKADLGRNLPESSPTSKAELSPDASTPGPEDGGGASSNATSTEKLAQRSVEAADHKCFLAFHPDLRVEQLNGTEEAPVQRNTSIEVWLYGFLSVGFISLSGIFGVIFVPLMKKRVFAIVMRFLVGLGIGALSATSILQLIPECFEIMDRDYLPSSVVIWMTIWVFFVFESVCKIILNNSESHHGHSHSTKRKSQDMNMERVPRPIYKHNPDNLDSANLEGDCFLPKSFGNGNSTTDAKLTVEAIPPSASNSKLNRDNKMAFHHRSHDYLAKTPAPPARKGLAAISSVAWMIILGDGIHNFIDGVSIGAGFTQSTLTGCSISLAIIFEEFPHELGDFAILISSGMSVKKALAFNFASACTAFLGLILGISLESFQINSYIFGLAGGLFLYISLSDLIPQLNNMLDEALEDEHLGRKNAFLIMLQQNLGILSGMGLIYIIAKFGHLITLQ